MFFPAQSATGGGSTCSGSCSCVVLMLLSLTLVKAATGRYRIGQAFRFYVTVPTALALCSLVLIWAL